MTDFSGIKIAREGETIESTDIDDYIFRSDVQSLPLIEKVLVNKTINSMDCEGTVTYTHNLGAFFFTQVFVIDKSFGNKQVLPFSITSPGDKTCDGDRLSEVFSYKIKENSVEIDYDVKCVIPMIGGECPGSNLNYTFEISIYLFELGV
jgi:hypothetical protein